MTTARQNRRQLPFPGAFNSSSLHFMLLLTDANTGSPTDWVAECRHAHRELGDFGWEIGSCRIQDLCRRRSLARSGTALRLTIATSAQDGSAISARTTAAPTCPVPPIDQDAKCHLISSLHNDRTVPEKCASTPAQNPRNRPLPIMMNNGLKMTGSPRSERSGSVVPHTTGRIEIKCREPLGFNPSLAA